MASQKYFQKILMVWNHLGFPNGVFLLGYSEKYCFSKALKHLSMMLGFWEQRISYIHGKNLVREGAQEVSFRQRVR